jgi:hypothetical protein
MAGRLRRCGAALHEFVDRAGAVPLEVERAEVLRLDLDVEAHPINRLAAERLNRGGLVDLRRPAGAERAVDRAHEVPLRRRWPIMRDKPNCSAPCAMSRTCSAGMTLWFSFRCYALWKSRSSVMTIKDKPPK